MENLHYTRDDHVQAHRRANIGGAPRQILYPLKTDAQLRKSGIVAQTRHAPGVPAFDPDRKRELGEVWINLAGDNHKIRVAHDPVEKEIILHGVHFQMSDFDKQMMRSFEATAAALNDAQGEEEQATQRELLGALIERVLRRNRFAADALVRQLRNERYTAV